MTLTFSPKRTSTIPEDMRRGSPIASGTNVRVVGIGALQDRHDRSGVSDAGRRLFSRADAIEEVLGLEAQRLHELDLRKKDVSAAIAEVRGHWLIEVHVLAEDCLPVDTLVVDGDLVVGHVVVDDHFP